MPQIVCYTRSARFAESVGRAASSPVAVVDTTPEMATRIIEDPEIACVVVHLERPDEYWKRFLASLGASFPLLPLVIFLGEGSAEEFPRATVFPVDPGDREAGVRLRGFLSSLTSKEKRKHQRFDWPLVGALALPGAPESSYKVRSISASGAFLECDGGFPDPGKSGMIRIRFNDFSILTGCQVLERRRPTKNQPAGFGVRFTDLTDASAKVIDGIVHDELIQSLVEPDRPPRPPSIAVS